MKTVIRLLYAALKQSSQIQKKLLRNKNLVVKNSNTICSTEVVTFTFCKKDIDDYKTKITDMKFTILNIEIIEDSRSNVENYQNYLS